MFSHRSFLMLGFAGAADIISLIKGGYEVSNFNFSFQQGTDERGKATTRVYSGTLHVTLPQLPPQDIIEWSIRSRKYSDGIIVTVDAENMPLERIIFKNATCIDLGVEYAMSGNSYSTTELVIQAEKLIVGNGIDFNNEWTS